MYKCDHISIFRFHGKTETNKPPIVYEWCTECGAHRTIEGTQLFPWHIPLKQKQVK